MHAAKAVVLNSLVLLAFAGRNASERGILTLPVYSADYRRVVALVAMAMALLLSLVGGAAGRHCCDGMCTSTRKCFYHSYDW